MLLHLGAWRVYYGFGLSGPIALGPEGGGLSVYSRVRCLRFRGLWYGRFQDSKGPARPCPSLHPFSGDAFGRTPRGSSPISQDPERKNKPNAFPIPCSPTAYFTIPVKLKQGFTPHERVCIIPKLTNGTVADPLKPNNTKPHHRATRHHESHVPQPIQRRSVCARGES